MSDLSTTCYGNSCDTPRWIRPIVITFLALAATLPLPLAAQTLPPADLQFHKFQPKVAPEQSVSQTSSTRGVSSNGISTTALQQMQALQQEKASRIPAQQKIDSNVLYTTRMLAGQSAAPGVPYLYTGVDLDRSDNLVLDIVAK